jgi:hypothetical protein
VVCKHFNYADMRKISIFISPSQLTALCKPTSCQASCSNLCPSVNTACSALPSAKTLLHLIRCKEHVVAMLNPDWMLRAAISGDDCPIIARETLTLSRWSVNRCASTADCRTAPRISSAKHLTNCLNWVASPVGYDRGSAGQW